MAAIPRMRLFLLIIVALLSVVASAGPTEASPADGREREVAHQLLRQARQLLDAHYRARPNAGFRYTAGLAAALAEIGDYDAAEATFAHLRLGDRFGDVHLRTLAIGYAGRGNLARVRQTIARIRDPDSRYAGQRPLAWHEAGKALVASGHEPEAAEAFAEAVRSMSVATDDPWQDADFLAQVAEGQYRLGRADESLATFKLAVSRALMDRKESMRMISLRKVAVTQARLGLLPQALSTVDEIEPKYRTSGWYDIVQVEADAGRLESAYRVAEQVGVDAATKTWMVLAEIKAGRLPEARGALEKAEAAVKQIAEGAIRIQQMLELAELRAAVGDRNAAADWLQQATALAEGAVIVESGPFAALRQIEKAPGAVARGFNHCVIAAAQAKLGFAENARRSFELAKVAAHGQQAGLWRDSALNAVAAAQAKAGFPDDAMRTLAALPDDAVKWLNYAPVAVARAKAGDLAGAEQVVNIYPLDARATRSHIAQALLEAGDLKNALRYGLMGEGWMEEILHDAARQLAASGGLATVTDAVPRDVLEEHVALLLGAAKGLLDRARASQR